MITLYAIGILPISLSKSCMGGEGLSGSYSIESQLASLDRASAWVNTEPIASSSLKGKVVLIEFCTYTCINWLRTLPYVRAWSDKYKKNGLMVIGVHTPEFPFESDTNNIRKVIGTMNIEFPIAVDNDRVIWNSFNNSYWPALYLIDGKGKIRHHQFGEGEYDKMERAIQQLLEEAGNGNADRDLVPGIGAGIEIAPDLVNLQSGEQYLGFNRSDNFASRGGSPGSRKIFSFPKKLDQREWALSGDWTLQEYSVKSNIPGGKMALRFHSRDVHLVMGPSTPGTTVRFRVSIDGKIVRDDHGIDVDGQGNGVIKEQRLYQLIRQTGSIIDREIEIEFLDAGAEAFSFTFG